MARTVFAESVVPTLFVPPPSSPSTPDSAAYTNFIARTTGLDSTHRANYKALLDGLTDDGLFNSDGTSNYLTALYWFKTQDQTTANLNLVSASLTLTPLGSPAFTADVGYTGVDSSTTVALDTGLPFTSLGMDDVHISVFSTTGAQAGTIGGTAIGVFDAGNSQLNQIGIYQSDTNTYGFMNSGFNGTSFVDSTAIGFYTLSRTTSTLVTLYKNAVSRATDTNATTNRPTHNIYILARDDVVSGLPTVNTGFGNTVKQASIGAGLTGAQVTALYARVNAW